MHKLILVILISFAGSVFAEPSENCDCNWVPANEAIEAVSSSLSLSRALHQKQYEQLLTETDFKLDAAVITLSKILPLIQDPEVKERAESYLGFVKKHRSTYSSAAIDSPSFKEALDYLSTIEMPKSEPSITKESIQQRLNDLSNRVYTK
jgi:hypothetical protein